MFRTIPFALALHTPITGLLAAIIAASWLAAPIAAQDPNGMSFCAYQPTVDDLAGVYTVTAGPSLLSSGSVTIPVRAIETYQVTLSIIGETLVLFSDSVPTVDLHSVGSEEPDWVGLGDVGDPMVTDSSDLGLLLDCDENSLLRISGTGIATSQEGRPFEFTLRLFAANDEMLIGDSTWMIDGMTMTQRQVYAEIGR